MLCDEMARTGASASRTTSRSRGRRAAGDPRLLQPRLRPLALAAHRRRRPPPPRRDLPPRARALAAPPAEAAALRLRKRGARARRRRRRRRRLRRGVVRGSPSSSASAALPTRRQRDSADRSDQGFPSATSRPCMPTATRGCWRSGTSWKRWSSATRSTLWRARRARRPRAGAQGFWRRAGMASGCASTRPDSGSERIAVALEPHVSLGVARGERAVDAQLVALGLVAVDPVVHLPRRPRPRRHIAGERARGCARRPAQLRGGVGGTLLPDSWRACARDVSLPIQ